MTLAPKFGSFDRDIKSKCKIMSLEVDNAYHTECSMKAIGDGYGLSLVCYRSAGTSFNHKNPIIKLRSLLAQGHLSTNGRQRSVPYHIIRSASIGVRAAYRALCGLLCLILWARPELADEVPG